MPPKQSTKQKSKIIQDKTFGLKNKNKSKKVQDYVNQVTNQVASSGNKKDRELAEKQRKQKEMKKMQQEKQKELAELFKTAIIQPKVPFGVDPKTILCAHFKANQCLKGAKCKFSHDLNVERKTVKASLYEDQRDKKLDTMENWDQSKLEDAVRQKDLGRENLNKATDIVCKYFLEAIQDHKYGWFWECPNGRDCKYRHCLPPGFVLKKKETEEEKRARLEQEKENALTIEDFLETERHKLGSDLTPVTSESFAKWKAERKKRELLLEEELKKKKADEFKKMKQGMKTGMIFSGKDLFDFNPDWIDQGDDGAMEEYERQDSDQGENNELDEVDDAAELLENLEGLESDEDS